MLLFCLSGSPQPGLTTLTEQIKPRSMRKLPHFYNLFSGTSSNCMSPKLFHKCDQYFGITIIIFHNFKGDLHTNKNHMAFVPSWTVSFNWRPHAIQNSKKVQSRLDTWDFNDAPNSLTRTYHQDYNNLLPCVINSSIMLYALWAGTWCIYTV